MYFITKFFQMREYRSDTHGARLPPQGTDAGHRNPALRACAALVMAALAAPVFAAGSIEKLQAFIAETRSARASFVQTQLDKKGKQLSSTSGKLSFSRPGKFRWEYEKPYEQTIVGDGVKLWIYDKDLNQVTVKKLKGAIGSSPAALLAGSNEIEEHYQLSAKGMKNGLDWLEAFPREESMFQKVRMGFKGNTLETMELFDHLGQVTSIQFGKVEKNPTLAGTVFSFTPPAGADVIDE